MLTFLLNYCREKCQSKSSAATGEGVCVCVGGGADRSSFYSLIRQNAVRRGYGLAGAAPACS